MGWKKKSAIPQIRAALREKIPEIIFETADEVLHAAKMEVPQPGRSQGYATGALKASGYIAVPDYEGAPHSGSYDYEAAITAAQAAPDTRILKRDQILPEMFVPPLPNGVFMAIVDFPLSYASLIHNGFNHIRAGRRITGVPFLDSAVNGREGDFRVRLTLAVQSLQNIGLPTETEKMATAYARELRAGKRSVRLSQVSWRETVLERSGEKLQRLRDPATGRIVEEFGEMWARVKNAGDESRSYGG